MLQLEQQNPTSRLWLTNGLTRRSIPMVDKALAALLTSEISPGGYCRYVELPLVVNHPSDAL